MKVIALIQDARRIVDATTGFVQALRRLVISIAGLVAAALLVLAVLD